MNDKLIAWWDGLSVLQKYTYLQGLIKRLKGAYVNKEKALKVEREFNGDRTGIRGGKRTTLAVNSERKCEAYNYLLEQFNYCSKNIE